MGFSFKNLFRSEEETLGSIDQEWDQVASSFDGGREAHEARSEAPRSRGKSINFPIASGASLFQPMHLKEAQDIVFHIESTEMVIVNMKNLNKEQAMKLFCYLQGYADAKNYWTSKIAPNTFAYSPFEVKNSDVNDLSSEFEDFDTRYGK